MTLSGNTITLLAVFVVLVIVVLALLLVIIRRLRARRDQLLVDLNSKPALVQDRAFNRLEMARKEAEVLGRTGTDIARAQELIAQAQGAFDNRQYPRSYELAQSAHEALVNARGRVGGVPSVPAPSRTARTAPPGALSSDQPSTAAPAPPPLARNRAESQFQLHLLDQELASARRDRPGAGSTAEAGRLQTEARAAFDRSDFTDAFRLSLRARRALGGKVESLAATAAAPRAAAAGSGPVDPASAAEQVASAARCPQCGYPTQAGDTFCRGCGTPRTPTACPACGATRAPTDTFCGRCGASFSS
jgi:hypothetical protein